MNPEEEALQNIVDAIKGHEIEFASKLAELHKLVIGLSGVMLSVLGSFQAVIPATNPQFSWLLQVYLVSFLLSVLIGVLALHGQAQTHQAAVSSIGQALKAPSLVQAHQQLAVSFSSQNRLSLYANTVFLACFVVGLASLTCYSVINV